jgi:hypothetical protein
VCPALARRPDHGGKHVEHSSTIRTECHGATHRTLRVSGIAVEKKASSHFPATKVQLISKCATVILRTPPATPSSLSQLYGSRQCIAEQRAVKKILAAPAVH